MDFLWEVADEIRRNGIYITPAKVQELMKDPDIWIQIFQTLKDEQMKVKALEAQVELDKPKVIFAESVETSKGSILIRELAKLLRQNGYITGEKRLFVELRERGYLIKRGADYNMPTQKSMELGLMEVLTRTVNRGEGEIKLCKTPKITGKGQVYFVNLFLGKKDNL
jgi:anti-repressor protein